MRSEHIWSRAIAMALAAGGVVGCGEGAEQIPAWTGDSGGASAAGGSGAASTSGGAAGMGGTGGGAAVRDVCPSSCPVDQVCDPRTHQCTLVLGEVHYVDLDASADGDGSYANPWSSIASVDAHPFDDGDDLYFKAGTQQIVSQRLDIDWSGTEDDPAVIGAYYGEGLFGLNDRSRPVLDADHTGGTLHAGLIRYALDGGTGHVHIMDLEVRNTIGYGVEINGWHGALNSDAGHYVTDCFIENVHTRDTDSMGIGLYRTHHSMVQNSIAENANQVTNGTYNGGCSIDVGALQAEGTSMHNTVRGCTVVGGNEGIGAYKGTRHFTIENNVVYDTRVPIYVANSRDGIIRNNIVYQTQGGRGRDQSWGITVDNEGHNPSVSLMVTGGVEIYGNMLAGLVQGISLRNNGAEFGFPQQGNDIHDNIIVDCVRNSSIRHSSEAWHDNTIRSNYSFIFDDDAEGLVHLDNDSPLGVTWDDNHFNSEVSGNATHGAHIDQAHLAKDSGWRDLPAGQVDASTFELL